MSATFAFLNPTRLGFLALGWLTLLVVLASAAPDGGGPGSREIGSAFDPATSVVTVGPQHPRAMAATRHDPAPPPASSAGGPDALTIAAVASARPAQANRARAFARLGDGPEAARSRDRAHGARAPPIA